VPLVAPPIPASTWLGLRFGRREVFVEIGHKSSEKTLYKYSFYSISCILRVEKKKQLCNIHK